MLLEQLEQFAFSSLRIAMTSVNLFAFLEYFLASELETLTSTSPMVTVILVFIVDASSSMSGRAFLQAAQKAA